MIKAASPVLLRIIILGAFFIYSTTLVLYPRPHVVRTEPGCPALHCPAAGHLHTPDLAAGDWLCSQLRGAHAENLEVRIVEYTALQYRRSVCQV